MSIVPKSGIEEAIPIWKKIDWSPEIERGIYKDWGKYYSRRRRESNAINYYDKAYSLEADDFMTLYYRSQSLRKIGKTATALADSREAQKILQSRASPQNYPVNREICDGIYELNQFENAKVELHNNSLLFSKNKSKSFEERLLVVDGNIRDACGDGLSPFILENEKLMTNAKKFFDDQAKVDKRPLWKILKEQDKCDVLSIPEFNEKLISPREIARRKRAFDICNQVYLNRSWTDVLFLRNLRTNSNVLMDQFKTSKKLLVDLTVKEYDVVRQFVKMIHARSPMYHIRYNKYANKSLLENFRETLLYRIQNQTRRNMISVLRTIKRLCDEQDLPKLLRYVEEVMGEYVVLKTYRIMPWKFEFICEVYNTLALALAEQYCVPKNFNETEKNALQKLLKLDMDKVKDIKEFVFGDRSTHHNELLLEIGMSKFRHQITRLEKRLVFAKHSIEKCYLLHQIASVHLDSNHYAECSFIATKAIEESSKCNSLIWNFLSTILIVKASAAVNKSERVKEALKNAALIADFLECEYLSDFVALCASCNEHVLGLKGSISIYNPTHRNSRVSPINSGLVPVHSGLVRVNSGLVPVNTM